MSALLTAEQRAQMLANGQSTAAGIAIDPAPVAKLFTPAARFTWLLTELDPEEPDHAFGLCDLGMGCPELGYVSLAELESVRGRLVIARDRYFKAKAPLSVYAEAASRAGHITEDVVAHSARVLSEKPD